MKASAFNKAGLLVLILFFLINGASAQLEKVEKKIQKTHSTDQKFVVEINNKFGDISLTHWDKNEVSVEVIITAEASSKEKAEDILNKISVDIQESDGHVTYTTKIDDNIHSNSKKKFDIHYIVHHPVYQTFILTNKYGNITMEELNGKLNVNLKYGNLKAKTLGFDDSKPLSEISVEYGNLDIDNCTWLKVIADYSNIDIDQSTALILVTKYTNADIAVNHALVADASYGNYKIGTIKSLILDGKYMNIEVGLLEKQLDLTVSYSAFKSATVSSEISKIQIVSKYTDVKIPVPGNVCYSINASTEYGDIDISPKANINRVKGNTKETFSGVVNGSANPSCEVSINTQYGGVDLE